MATKPRTNRTSERTYRGDWRKAWLLAYRKTGMVSSACEAVGISRRNVYNRRDTDIAFREAWDALDERITDKIEKVAVDRAIYGESDRMIEFTLRSRRAKLYRDNVKIEHTGPGGGPQQIVVVEADHERASGVASILAEMGAAEAPTASSNGRSNGKAG